MNIEAVRANIDALDKQIVGLIAQRQGWVVEAGKLKTDHDGVRAPQRVEAVITKVRALAADSGADPEVVERTYRAMIEAFIALELTVHDGLHRSDPR
jgi:isochorismate pyruvate lyase